MGQNMVLQAVTEVANITDIMEDQEVMVGIKAGIKDDMDENIDRGINKLSLMIEKDR